MTIATDNYDLFIRRRRLGLTQRDIARALPTRVALSAISDFENGEREDLPHGQGRPEYEAILDRIERERENNAGGAK